MVSTIVVEQRLEVGGVGHAAVGGTVQRRPPGLGLAVDDRELDLVLVGVEVEEQLVGLVDDLGDPGVGAVDLVDDQDDGQPLLQRLAQHEPGLRQRALGGVDQQQDAVDHLQAALDLATEVGVAGGVDDVDRDAAEPSAILCRTAVFFARIVMPFSRSRSIESMTRSLTEPSSAWWAEKAPDCQSIASTSVVLPWSTWATIATLRRSSRLTRGRGSRVDMRGCSSLGGSGAAPEGAGWADARAPCGQAT